MESPFDAIDDFVAGEMEFDDVMDAIVMDLASSSDEDDNRKWGGSVPGRALQTTFALWRRKKMRTNLVAKICSSSRMDISW